VKRSPKRFLISSASMAEAGSISPAEISGMSPVLVVGALLGQMKLTKPKCGQAVSLLGLSEAAKRLLSDVQVRRPTVPLTEPLIYRFDGKSVWKGRKVVD